MRSCRLTTSNYGWDSLDKGVLEKRMFESIKDLLIVIPARGGSKGLQGKNLRILGDIPLLIKPLKYGRILFSYLRKNKKKHGGEIEIYHNNIDKIKLFDFEDEKNEAKYNIFWNSIKKQYKIST